MRKSIPTGQEMDLGNLRDYWSILEAEFTALESLAPLAASRTLSARAFDESQPAGLRTYMEVTRFLGVARDNHEALVALLAHHGATPWAPWSLLRPTFETAFLAAWILDPEDGIERRARGLRCEIRDLYEQRAHRAAFNVVPEARTLIEAAERKIDRGSLATYKGEAAALGRNFDRLRQKVNLVDELPRLSSVTHDSALGAYLIATWRQLSGFEHGLGWAVLGASDRTITAEIPGGADVHLVINDEAFVNSAKATYFLLVTACRLLRRRHEQP